MFVCMHCGRSLKTKNGLTNHERWCSCNPNQPTERCTLDEKAKKKISLGLRNRAEKLRDAGIKITHTEETKKKISEARLRFLKENPDKAPYALNHYSRGESYPERYWKQILIDHKIPFEQEKRLSLYRLDFAIGNINLEIDGEQHYCDPRIMRSNIRRDDYLRSLGWKVHRIRWSDFQKMDENQKKNYIHFLMEDLLRIELRSSD